MSCRVSKNGTQITDLKTIRKNEQIVLTASSADTVAPVVKLAQNVATAIIFNLKKEWYYLSVNGITRKPDIVMP